MNAFSAIMINCKRFLFLAGLLIPVMPLWAQKQNSIKTKKETVADENLNKRDAKQRKQGMWFYDIPVHFGDPGYYEFGAYKDDLKTGLWYKMSRDQQLIAIENFKLDVPDGPAQYFENGKLASVGTYRGIYTPYDFDTVLVLSPISLEDSMVVIPADRGYTKHGTWRYYDPASGHLILEREYQVDYLLKEKKFELPKRVEESKGIPAKLPHEGGKDRGWNTGKEKNKKSLIK